MILTTGITLFIIAIVVIYLIPAPKYDFFILYPHNDKASQSLKQFKSKPIKELKIDGVPWKYYVEGHGSKSILFVHGMGGAYNIWWQQAAALEEKYQIVTFTLPEEISSLKKASEGILRILAAEHINHFIVVGTSMGGYIAQYLVNTIPDRIEKAVFGNTFPPNNRIAKENSVKSKLVPLLPEMLIAKLGDNQLRSKILPAANNSDLLAATLKSLPFSKKQFINRYFVVVDPFTTHPGRLEIHKIPKLILESDNDPLIELPLRKALKDLYPDAKVHTFHQEGHFPYINAAGEYNKVLASFLSGNLD